MDWIIKDSQSLRCYGRLLLGKVEAFSHFTPYRIAGCAYSLSIVVSFSGSTRKVGNLLKKEGSLACWKRATSYSGGRGGTRVLSKKNTLILFLKLFYFLQKINVFHPSIFPVLCFGPIRIPQLFGLIPFYRGAVFSFPVEECLSARTPFLAFCEAKWAKQIGLIPKKIAFRTIGLVFYLYICERLPLKKLSIFFVGGSNENYH